MPTFDFPSTFKVLTGSAPFPWQSALYAEFLAGRFPKSASIPTGLGKTSIIAIWLIALAQHPDRTPRRLVYVVNRRTVVDQTTTEVQKLRDALTQKPELSEIRQALTSLCALPLPSTDASPLAISTLRGQFADNGEWGADPSRPAVIAGTVDMIGSGLLFSRYTRGFKTRPMHAAFLAQDALLIHDEAHLEPAFQKLLDSIVATQNTSHDQRKLRILELTATSRTSNSNVEPAFTLTHEDRNQDEIVRKRYNAAKRLKLIGLSTDEKLISLANEKTPAERAVLIFTRSVESAVKIAAELNKGELKGKVATLTGTMRGKERDELVSSNPIFQRFLPEKDRSITVKPILGTVFLVSTSAGEVGVNISADDLLCDLSTYDSMAQRFGRVNRFGLRDDSTITVIHETEFDESKPIEAAQKLTLTLLQRLNGSASPAALDTLPPDERAAAFSPPPAMRTATNIQFDAWALTSIRKPIPAQPLVAPYLHGESEWQPPETQVAWRKDLDILEAKELQDAHPPADLLEDFPLLPHELLRDTTKRVFASVKKLIENTFNRRETENANNPEKGEKAQIPAWLIKPDGEIESLKLSLSNIDNKNNAENLEASLEGSTLILPASIGGIQDGLLSSGAPAPTNDKADVSDFNDHRPRIFSPTRDVPENHRLIRIIDTALGDEDSKELSNRYWLWLEKKLSISPNNRNNSTSPETLDEHTSDVAANAYALALKLLPAASESPGSADEPDLRRCLVLAAQWHDLGKNRASWQRNLGNLKYDATKPDTIFAKSGPSMRSRNLAEHYRHEFGSLNDAAATAEFASLNNLERDIVLHLIATHHGRARPHFPIDEIGDIDNSTANPKTNAALAVEIPRRFARLQKRYGRWGLAYLESLLRAADYAASAGIIAEKSADLSSLSSIASNTASSPRFTHDANPVVVTAKLALDSTNPGHFFACCGLFELAAILSPDALAWFEQDSTTSVWHFHLANTPPLAELLDAITSAQITADIEPAFTNQDPINSDEDEENSDEDDDKDDSESKKEASAPPLRIGKPFDLRLDWWITASPKTTALKVWAGTMKVLRIAISMRQTIREIARSPSCDLEQILFDAQISLDPFKIEKAKEKSAAQYEDALKEALIKHDEALKVAAEAKSGEKLEKEKLKIAAKYSESCEKALKKRDELIAKAYSIAKTEPFYFDANRGPNADARDVGFAPNDLKLRTLAAPAAEFLTLIGLQRAIPQPSGDRLFDYHLWLKPVPITLVAAAINGLTELHQPAFRFESWYRTSQRKHKAFLPAKAV